MNFKTQLLETLNSLPSASSLRPVLEALPKELPEHTVYIIAIDGRSASGKTTLANQLGSLLNADVLHMDDFFLPPKLRTKERLDMPGGNVHYERFMEEVLPYLSAKQPFSYRIFNCCKMDYDGRREMKDAPFRIVEGSYSHHPLFKDYADLTVFSDIEPEEQMRRIRLRNGDEKAEVFKNKWIPLEERYFKAFDIAKKASVYLK